MATAELDNPDLYPPLDASRFEILHDVPIFDEHEDEEPIRDENGRIAREEDGTPKGTRRIRYTRDVLESICENVNRRIRDTGDYTAICIGHTPTPEERRGGAKPQPAIGMAGPYYVADFGKENPRPTIYARNWAVFREDADLARKHPRRSVELWAEADLHDRFFDPISLLGAEMPRRDLGLLYSRANGRHAVPVVRYSAVFPSGGNTFVPGADEKERYQKPEQSEGSSMITDEDIQKIIAGVGEMAEIQFVRTLMEAEQAKGDPAPEAAPEQFSAEETDDTQPAGDEEGLPSGTPVERNSEPEMNDEKEKELFRRREADKIRYSRIEAENRRLADENKAMNDRLSKVESHNRQVVRYSQISKLADEFLLDPEEEMKRADAYDEDRWNDHVENIVKKHYQRNPVGRPMLPPGEAPQPKAPEKHAARVREKIEAYSRAGVHKQYHEIVAEVDQELGQAK